MSAFLMLLSTDHCELCDEALSMLFSMPELAGLELRVVDVADDDDLLERYGDQVPVLQVYKAEAAGPLADQPELALSLGWPFSADSVGHALRSLAP